MITSDEPDHLVRRIEGLLGRVMVQHNAEGDEGVENLVTTTNFTNDATKR